MGAWKSKYERAVWWDSGLFVWKKPNGKAPRPSDIWKWIPSPKANVWKKGHHSVRLSFINCMYSGLVRLVPGASWSGWYCIARSTVMIMKTNKRGKERTEDPFEANCVHRLELISLARERLYTQDMCNDKEVSLASDEYTANRTDDRTAKEPHLEPYPNRSESANDSLRLSHSPFSLFRSSRIDRITYIALETRLFLLIIVRCFLLISSRSRVSRMFMLGGRFFVRCHLC